MRCGNAYGDLRVTELPEDCRGRWESFVEETLTETNRRNTVDLVRTGILCIFRMGLLSSGLSLTKKKEMSLGWFFSFACFYEVGL